MAPMNPEKIATRVAQALTENYLKFANLIDFAKRWARLDQDTARQVEDLIEYANTVATCELYGKPLPIKKPNVCRAAIEEARQALAGASSDLDQILDRYLEENS